MTPEQRMWAQLHKAVGNKWHATRHEDTISKGIPDVSFGAHGKQGWIELKVLDKWPAKPSTIIHLPLFTKEQKAWLTMRGIAGGRCFFLLKVDTEDTWLLYKHTNVLLIGSWAQQDMLANALAVWQGVPSADSIISRLVAN